MRIAFIFISVVLLSLSNQTFRFVSAVLHLVHHEHTHGPRDYLSSSGAFNLHGTTTPQPQPSGQGHQKSPQKPTHSHERDVWGMFAHLGLVSSGTIVLSESFQFRSPQSFEVRELISDLWLGSLLRPPIA